MVDNIRLTVGFRKLKNDKTRFRVYNCKKLYDIFDDTNIDLATKRITRLILKKLQYYIVRNFCIKVAVENRKPCLNIIRYIIRNNDDVNIILDKICTYLKLRYNERDCNTIKFIFNIKNNQLRSL
jgi:hypothetical protein